MSDPQQLKKLHDDIAAMGISWNNEAGRELNGEPLRLWDEDGDPREDHPWIAGQVLARKNAAALVQKFIESTGAVPSVSPAPQEQEWLADYEEAKGYLGRLLVHCAPQCEPMPTLAGICTQIDNYIAGLHQSVHSPSAVSTPDLSQLTNIIASMRKAAKRWNYNQHDENDVIAWADELESLISQTKSG